MKKVITDLDLSNVSKGTVIRGVLMALVVVNYVLSTFNINPIEIDESMLGTVVTVALTVGTAIISYWKNNSFTKAAQEADKKRKELEEE